MTRVEPILFLSFTLGVLAGYFIRANQNLSFVSFILFSMLTLILLLTKKVALFDFSIAATIFLFGFVYTNLHYEMPLRKDHISNFADGEVYGLEGYIYKPVERSEERDRIYLKALRLSNRERRIDVSGRVRINIPKRGDNILPSLDVGYGDLLEMKVKLYRVTNFKNPGGIDYAGFLTRKKIFVIGTCVAPAEIEKLGENYGNKIVRILYRTRDRILKACEEDMDYIPFQIFAAMVFGDRSFLTPFVEEKFTAVGIAHVISISGLHVGFVALIFYGLFKEILLQIGFINRYRYAGRICSLMTIFPVIAYSIMCGLRIPTVRAMIMITIYLLGRTFYRSRNTVKSLAAAWVIILLLDPASISDAGFQLSFLAVATILYAHHFVSTRNLHRKISFVHRKVLFYFVSIVFVYLMVLPVILYHFNKISIFGILGNLVLAPLSGVIISLGILNSIFILFKIPIYHIINFILSLSLNLILSVMDLVSRVKFCEVFFPLNTLAPIIFYYLLLLTPIFIKKGRRLASISSLIFLIISVILNFPLFRGDKLRVSYLDLDNGTSIHASLPSGGDILVDCGSRFGTNVGSFVMDPYLHHSGITRFDKVILSHAHYDHSSGIRHILENYPVNVVILGSSDISSSVFKDLMEVVHNRKIPYRRKDYGYDEVGKFASLNNRSYIFKLKYNKISFLFPADADNIALYSLLRYSEKLKSTVLFLPHEGSANSSPVEFLEKVSPKIAVVSVSEKNYFRHPAQEVMRRIEKLEPKPDIYMTGRDGAIIITTDGESVDVKTWHTRWK